MCSVLVHTFACVLSDVHTKLNDVSGEDLAGWTLLRAATQPLAVDERPVAAFSVLQVELTHKRKAGENHAEIWMTMSQKQKTKTNVCGITASSTWY